MKADSGPGVNMHTSGTCLSWMGDCIVDARNCRLPKSEQSLHGHNSNQGRLAGSIRSVPYAMPEAKRAGKSYLYAYILLTPSMPLI